MPCEELPRHFWWREDGLLAEVTRKPNETVAKFAAQVVSLNGKQPQLFLTRTITADGFTTHCATLKGACEVAALTLEIGRKPNPVAQALRALNRQLGDHNLLLSTWAVPPAYSSMLGISFGGQKQTLDRTPEPLRQFCYKDANGIFSRRL